MGALTLTASLAAAAPRATAPAAGRSGTRARIATKPASPVTASPAATGSRMSGPVVATVNGEPISETEWLSRLRLMAGKNALDNLVREKILRQEARKNGITVSPAETAAKAAEIEKVYRERTGSPAKFEEFLKQQGLTLTSFQAAIRSAAEMQTLQQKLSQKLGEQVQISDKELQDTYEKQKFQFFQPAEIKISHIMLNFTGTDDASQKKTKEEATALLEKVKAPGADFAALAKEFSQDTDTKEKGGELPWMSYSPWGPPFDQVVMAAPVGLMAEPVRSFKGYHIIKVQDKRPQRVRPFDEVKDDLRKRLLEQRKQQQFREHMQKAESTAKTEVKLKF
jgi:parvulin-like peptidyl-prolyl isomerase